jgi:hypothetical protein
MTLRELLQFVTDYAEQSGHAINAEIAGQIEQAIVQAYPAEKVYIPRPDRSKKPEILEAAKRLPSNVVAARLGVSRQWVHKVTKR